MNTPQADHVAALQEILKSKQDNLAIAEARKSFWREPLRKDIAALTAAIEAMQRQGEPVGMIAAERQRQVEAEGWTHQHDDDEWEDDQLAMAAVSYALPERFRMRDGLPRFWPWAITWWKPKDRIRDLVRAGALIVAEIERLQRAAGGASR